MVALDLIMRRIGVAQTAYAMADICKAHLQNDKAIRLEAVADDILSDHAAL